MDPNQIFMPFFSDLLSNHSMTLNFNFFHLPLCLILTKSAVTFLGPFIAVEEGLIDPERSPDQFENLNFSFALAAI